MLAFILDVSRTNGQTIWAINMGIDPRRLKSQEFLWHLILQMVTPHIQRRSLSATFRRTSGIIKSTLEYFLLITKNDRAQCQVGQYLYTVASWAYKDKKGYHSKFQLILAILGPLIPKLCSDKSESGGNKSCFLLQMLEISQGETRIHFPPL